MAQEGKIFVCKKYGKEVHVLKEGKNTNLLGCCREPMGLRECCK